MVDFRLQQQIEKYVVRYLGATHRAMHPRLDTSKGGVRFIMNGNSTRDGHADAARPCEPGSLMMLPTQILPFYKWLPLTTGAARIPHYFGAFQHRLWLPSPPVWVSIFKIAESGT